MPPPTPVPRITPNTRRWPAPAPSLASESAKQLASFSTRTSRPSARVEVVAERPAVQLGRVGVLDQAGGRRDRARRADADAGRARRARLRSPRRARARRRRLRVVVRRRGDAAARQLAAGVVDRDRLDLGAAEVDADADHGDVGAVATCAGRRLSAATPAPVARAGQARARRGRDRTTRGRPRHRGSERRRAGERRDVTAVPSCRACRCARRRRPDRSSCQALANASSACSRSTTSHRLQRLDARRRRRIGGVDQAEMRERVDDRPIRDLGRAADRRAGRIRASPRSRRPSACTRSCRCRSAGRGRASRRDGARRARGGARCRRRRCEPAVDGARDAEARRQRLLSRRLRERLDRAGVVARAEEDERHARAR